MNRLFSCYKTFLLSHGGGGGQVVSVNSLHFEDLSSNPADFEISFQMY